MHLVGVAPVQHKLRYPLLGELPVNVGHGQNIETIRRRLPVIGNAGGQRGMLGRGAEARPLLTHMGNKFAVPGFADLTALSPVEYKLGHGIGNKLRINASALQNLQGIFVRLPVVPDGQGVLLLRVKGTLQPLLLTGGIVAGKHPLAFYMAEKTHVPVVAVGALFVAQQ